MLECYACVLICTRPLQLCKFLALQAGGAALLEYLLQAGARVGAGDARARMPLHYAILFDNAEAAKLLLRRGASRCVARTLLCMVAMLTPSDQLRNSRCHAAYGFRHQSVHAVWHMLAELFFDAFIIIWFSMHSCRKGFQGLHGNHTAPAGRCCGSPHCCDGLMQVLERGVLLNIAQWLQGCSGRTLSACSGARRQARDALGQTALETAMSLGAIPDVELFMLLSE